MKHESHKMQQTQHPAHNMPASEYVGQELPIKNSLARPDPMGGLSSAQNSSQEMDM